MPLRIEGTDHEINLSSGNAAGLREALARTSPPGEKPHAGASRLCGQNGRESPSHPTLRISGNGHKSTDNKHPRKDPLRILAADQKATA